MRSLEMLWIVTLNNDTKVYSDYYNPDYPEPPWLRLKRFCRHNPDFYPVKIESFMYGAPTITMAENPNGLDGVFVLRGAAKEYDTQDGPGASYRHLIVGVLNDYKDHVDITKFVWPENVLEPFNQTRLVTKENAELMLFKNGSKKLDREVVRLALDGQTV